jgi:hypothetical protein
MRMKALSLRQPWAWMVIHGGKSIENRRWNTRYRGPVLVHAAKGMTRDEYLDAAMFAAEVDQSVNLPAFSELERGGIVGATTITGVIPPRNNGLFSAEPVPWHMADQFGFRLGPRIWLQFRALKGELGFFNVEITAEEEAVLRREGLVP